LAGDGLFLFQEFEKLFDLSGPLRIGFVFQVGLEGRDGLGVPAQGDVGQAKLVDPVQEVFLDLDGPPVIL
jgi:hypothetical protein